MATDRNTSMTIEKIWRQGGGNQCFFNDKGYSIWRAKQVLVSLFWANIPSFRKKGAVMPHCKKKE
jgi:hypothetical protein